MNSFGEWFSALLLLSSVAFSISVVVLKTSRHRAAGTWACGFFAGLFFLARGDEYLAFVQWVIASLAPLCMVFLSGLFGDLSQIEKVRNAPGLSHGFKKYRRSLFSVFWVLSLTGLMVLSLSEETTQKNNLGAELANGSEWVGTIGQHARHLSFEHVPHLAVVLIAGLLCFVGVSILLLPAHLEERRRAKR